MSEDQKIDAMADRIRAMESKAGTKPAEGSDEPMQGSRIGIDFMASILGGALLGWLVEIWHCLRGRRGHWLV